tara:strand:- start:496 stop:2343 length:1848 start_codon:yes stop_codon:yes gene_type:complete
LIVLRTLTCSALLAPLPALADGIAAEPFDLILAVLLLAMISVFTVLLLLQQRQLRARSDRQLGAHTALLGNIFGALPEMVFYKDRRGVYRLCNGPGSRFLGRPADEIKGQRDTDFFDVQSAERMRQRDVEAIERRSAIRSEEWLPGPDGEQVLLEINRQPLFSDTQECVGVLLTCRDITESRQKQKELEHQARHDILTGLANRALLHEKLTFALQMAKRNDESLAVIFIDLDRFREVNDALGHTVGDLLLRDVAHRLSSNLRDSDICARLSGDEFVVVLTQADKAYVESKCTQLLEALARAYQLQGHLLSINASAGIALTPEHGDNSDILLVHADAALHHAKALGRNRSCIYSQELSAHKSSQLSLEQDLRDAVENEEFSLEFQGQFRPGERVPRRVETLIRWPHELRGQVSPHEFIPLAESSGLIRELGFWVLRRACAEFMSWRQQGMKLDKIAVNVSAMQINSRFAETVETIMKETGFEPAWLELEVTESLMMSGMTEVNNQIHQLRALGVEFSIDDFGTGYSSLSKLKEMPVSVLKIDRSFVRNIHDQENDYEIARAIVAMADSLNIEVVAEGVENEEQGETLRHLGCEWLQGYLYGRPMAADDFLRHYSET